MRITKYVHSCLLVEDGERVGIIDPGQFSWESGLFSVERLGQLDDIIITHEHPDHMHIPFIQALLATFPKAHLTANPSVVAKLQEQGIMADSESRNGVELFVIAHEPLAPLGEVPENQGVQYLGRLTHPGDSQHVSAAKDILALPVTGPWGSLVQAAALGTALKPRFIIPIHDWHWNPAARGQAYDRLAAYFEPLGIQFVKPADGVPFEL